MAYIIGIDDVSKKVKEIAVGTDDVAKPIKSAYIGVDGVARKFFQRGYYQKRLYFFGYTGTLGDNYLTNKLYSVQVDGTAPIEYTLETPIYAFYKGNDNAGYFPPYATWANIISAKLYYDPNTQRLCIVGFGNDMSVLHFYTIDCNKNIIIDHQTYNQGYFVGLEQFAIYYSYELGCVFYARGRGQNARFVCYNIRTSVLNGVSYTPETSSGYLNIRGIFATPITNGARLSVVYANNIWEYRNIQSAVFDFDTTAGTITTVSGVTSMPTDTYRVCFIPPHSFINKNTFNSVNGICFVGNTYDSATTEYKSTAGYVITKDGYKGNYFTIPNSMLVNRVFGASNVHGQIWAQDNNGIQLGKYSNAYSSIINPIGSLTNNSCKTYEGPVIGGGIITGYTSTSTAVIYANISGSYYNITPTNYGAYNNAVFEGVNLKECLIPNTNQVLVYDFNQAAYTTPINIADVLSLYNINLLPYTAILTWTKSEQDALVNLGY